MKVRPWVATPGLAGRLLSALALVVFAGGLTAWLVAGAIGPVVFHQHMGQAGLDDENAAILHAEEAFRSASAVALAIALTASVIASLGVSIFLTRRIAGSLSTLSLATASIAAGDFDSRVASPRLGVEFDQLADAFNHMATQLEESEALRLRLLADVAHEVRTPVAVISAYLEGLEDGVESLTPHTVAVLRDQGSRLAKLATDLAAVTRAERGDLGLVLETVSPGVLLARAQRTAQERFTTAGVGLTVVTHPDAPAVRVDADRIAQVLGNLVDNALQHTPRGGTVTVSADVVEGGPVRIAVADTGEGIAPAHLPHVFERFYRVDTARDRGHGGSGIGLAIVRAIVLAHGGWVTVASEGLGRGATFEVMLPQATSPHPRDSDTGVHP